MTVTQSLCCLSNVSMVRQQNTFLPSLLQTVTSQAKDNRRTDSPSRAAGRSDGVTALVEGLRVAGGDQSQHVDVVGVGWGGRDRETDCGHHMQHMPRATFHKPQQRVAPVPGSIGMHPCCKYPTTNSARTTTVILHLICFFK